MSIENNSLKIDSTKLISNIVDSVTKKFGKDALYSPADDSALSKIAYRISTGNIALDKITGGGIPSGRLTEIFGDFSTGKSVLGMQILANTQKMGGIALYIDTEVAMDAEWAKKVTGLDLKNIYSSSPDCIEEVVDMINEIVNVSEKEKEKALITIVIDSIASLSYKIEMEHVAGVAEVGTRARLWSQALRKMMRKVSRENIALVFINQIRENVGVIYGTKTTTPGGKAIKFHSSLRLELKIVRKVVDELGNVTGVNISIETVKNKMAPPFKKSSFILDYEKGIGKYDGLAQLLVQNRVLSVSGGWYGYNGKKFHEPKIEQMIKENPDILEKLKIG